MKGWQDIVQALAMHLEEVVHRRLNCLINIVWIDFVKDGYQFNDVFILMAVIDVGVKIDLRTFGEGSERTRVDEDFGSIIPYTLRG